MSNKVAYYLLFLLLVIVSESKAHPYHLYNQFYFMQYNTFSIDNFLVDMCKDSSMKDQVIFRYNQQIVAFDDTGNFTFYGTYSYYNPSDATCVRISSNCEITAIKGNNHYINVFYGLTGVCYIPDFRSTFYPGLALSKDGNIIANFQCKNDTYL